MRVRKHPRVSGDTVHGMKGVLVMNFSLQGVSTDPRVRDITVTRIAV